MRIFVLTLILVFQSCSSINYRSQDKNHVRLGNPGVQSKRFSSVFKKEFYLWGFLPKDHTINLDDSIKSLGIVEAGKIEIEQYRSTSDIFKTIFSFGMYSPIHYRISGFGVDVE